MKRLRRRWREDGGVTLIELLVSLTIASVVGMALVSWMMSAMSAANLHRDDDHAVQGLREAHERLTREVRLATELLDASSTVLVLWVDSDWDGEPGSGEIVTWELTTGGALVRYADDGSEWEVTTGLIQAESGFSIDGASVADTRVVGIVLVASVGTGDSSRTMTGQVYLRNAP